MSKKIDDLIKSGDQAEKVLISSLVILFLLLIIAIVGKFSKDDNDESEILYCKMVQEGVWPDYNETYKLKCIKKVEKAK